MNLPAQHDSFNGLKSRTIFCFWTGSELLSENRLKALWSIFKNTGRPVAFVTQETLDQWILPNYPLHPAYAFLSATHKSDYLRCYFMHFYGGGYTDIKINTVLWEPFFLELEVSINHMALGYPELTYGIPHLEGVLGDQIRAVHQEIIGLCAFIFKPKTILTTAWYEQVNSLLNEKLPLLRTNPGKFPLDQTGMILQDGTASPYPLRWAEILGEILHPLFYTYRHQLIKAPIEPKFLNYR